MPATYNGQPVRMRIGGQGFLISTSISCNLSTVGFGGLDAGVLAANTLYYIYAVVSSNAVGLVCSLNAPSVGPTGFTQVRWVGKFRTFFGSAGVADLALVNISVGTGDEVPYQNISDPVIYTSTTPNNSFSATTALTNSFTQWRRVGSSMHLSGYFRPAITQGVEARISLPTGYTVGSIAGGSATTFVIGKWARDNGVATTAKQGTVLATQGQQFIRFSFDDYNTAIDPIVPMSAANFANNTDVDYVGELIIPIAEWSSLFT